MPELPYEDDNCTYCWGDPRLDQRFVPGKLVLSADGVRFVGEHDTLAWPKGNIRSVEYAPTHGVDLEELARSYGIEAAQDIDLGLADHVPEPALRLVVEDPEGVELHGFDVRVMFRNEYYAKVFAKRMSAAFGMPFKADDHT
jgi:hypothetical protein